MPPLQGNIYHAEFAGIPHGKFFIIIQTAINRKTLATVFINTDINPRKFPTQELKDLHLKIFAKDYSFLNHDSYIDCSDIIERDFLEIEEYIAEHPRCSKGSLIDSDLKEVMTRLMRSPLISPKIRIKYGI